MGGGLQPRKAELLAAGARVGRYHLLQRLAVGGMAELHLACAEGLAGFQKVVVLKRVLPHLANDPEFVEMFLNEARIAATLAHPNIVHVTDIGETSGDYFYAMEYVHGCNARELLRAGASSGGIPLDVALTITIAAASALEHTHSACSVDGSALGLIHRDVSPANILVSYEGTAKLTDFGIAKASEKNAETIGGAIKGKVGYMSPEQCRGEPIDQRSDLFALGVVLFELTTCQRLFYGDNDFAILNKVLKGQIDRPHDRVPSYPAELEQIVLKALASDPDQRYSTATELRQDLESFAHEARMRTTPAVVAWWMKHVLGTTPPPRVEVARDADAGPVVPTLVVAVRTEDRDVPDISPTHPDVRSAALENPRAVLGDARIWLAVTAAAVVAVIGGGLFAWSQREPGPDAVPVDAGTSEVVAAPEPRPIPQPHPTEAPPSEPKASKPEPAEVSPTPQPEAPHGSKKRAPRRKSGGKKKRPDPTRDMDDPFPVPI